MLIAFRESFEAAVLVAIVASYLRKTGRENLLVYLSSGAVIGAVSSVLTGLTVYYTYRATGMSEIFEAASAFLAVPILTSVIYWMAVRSGDVKAHVEGRIEAATVGRGGLGLMLVGGFLVFREGLETVLFTLPLMFRQPFESLVGVTLGIVGGSILSYSVFRLGLRMDFRRFFYYTSILLIFVASGILGYGVHELIEYGEEAGWSMGVWSAPVYQLPLTPSSLLHDEGPVGSILSVLLGYTSKMELGRAVVQLSYLAGGLLLIRRAYSGGTKK